MIVADRCYSVVVDFTKVHDLDYTSVMVRKLPLTYIPTGYMTRCMVS